MEYPKRYKFELTFTGLCVFTFLGDKYKPKEVNVLMVDTRHGHHHHHGGGATVSGADRHYPILSYDPRNLYGKAIPPYQLEPDPDGGQIALQDLTGHALEIVLPIAGNPLTCRWRDSGKLGPNPKKADDEYWLDWAMALQRMNPETPPPDYQQPFGGLSLKHVIARARIRQGRLSARGYLHIKGSGYQLWSFEDPGDVLAKTGPHAMAASIVLLVRGLPTDKPVRLIDRGFEVALRPFELADGSRSKVVSASITNLPHIEAGDAAPKYLDHFRHFYDLVKFPPGVKHLRLPTPVGVAITSGGSFCPPTTHTEKD